MRDNGDNQEMNIGLGYRRLVPEARGIVGVHGWLDQRETSRGMPVRQVTAGLEYLGEDFDARVNGYLPVGRRKRTWTTPNTGSDDPYLAGNGIFVDTTGEIVEEAQPGFDVELGIPVSWQSNRLDAARLYGGVYSFYGDETPDVSGVRFRAVADISPAVSIGARLQTDNARGEQAYLDLTLRFPFTARRSQRDYGLKARLDEAPERDIDIVTGEVANTSRRMPVLNAETGAGQHVIYVDNTAAAGGDGSKERPFNTLAAAQSVLSDHDIIYIAHGDGTTAGQDAGLTIAQNNVMVVGSGVDFVWDSGRFTPSAGGSIANGTLLLAATSAPVITNTAGDGIFVSGANPYLTGFAVDGASGNGIHVRSDSVMHDTVTVANTTVASSGGTNLLVDLFNGSIADAITVANNTITSTAAAQHNLRVILDDADADVITLEDNVVGGASTNAGLWLETLAGAHVDSAFVSDNTVAGIAGTGLLLQAKEGSLIDNISILNNSSNGNTGSSGRGIMVEANGAGSTIGVTTLAGNITSNNASTGTYILGTDSGLITAANIDNHTSTGNDGTGLYVRTVSDGDIGTVDIFNSNSSSNIGSSGRGFIVEANGAGSTIGVTTLAGNTASNNAKAGIYIVGTSSGVIASATLTGNTTGNNASIGIYILGSSSGTITSAALTGNTSTGNTGNGVFIDDDTTAAFVADLGGGALGSTGNNRIYGNAIQDIRVDMDGGQLKAENNWWGVATGLAGGETTLDSGSTIDADPFLASDPGP